ncbi:hypothetical protein [Adhaeribacter radiodurans]|uniref:DUF5640 domain-containing protein n=1 Tax=Adhaeribacter radiodurans TaxID=2745197 RepID=A0A7L7L1P5_9BACT|nr:hypothetical protein [Adhaeribacter radiodurans]QMU26708.1 hypothetical protein HUW48_01070 [Adhaeribacter radiodurans]
MKIKILSLSFACVVTQLFAGNTSQTTEVSLVGKWNNSGLIWSLNADHTFKFLNGDSSISGKYTVERNQITIVDEAATGFAQTCGSDKKGIYEFRIDGKTLTITEVKDTCTDRIGEVIGTYNLQ